MKNEQQPAYPCMPIQDQFKRLIAPIPGMSKFELVFLEMYKLRIGYIHRTDTENITEALKNTEAYFKGLEAYYKTKEDLKIIE